MGYCLNSLRAKTNFYFYFFKIFLVDERGREEGKKEHNGTSLGSNRSDTKFDVGRSGSNSHTERITQEFSNNSLFIQFKSDLSHNIIGSLNRGTHPNIIRKLNNNIIKRILFAT